MGTDNRTGVTHEDVGEESMTGMTKQYQPQMKVSRLLIPYLKQTPGWNTAHQTPPELKDTNHATDPAFMDSAETTNREKNDNTITIKMQLWFEWFMQKREKNLCYVVPKLSSEEHKWEEFTQMLSSSWNHDENIQK